MALPALNLLSTFAGIGMLDEAVSLALAVLGREARTVCYVEREAPAAAIMAARVEEGSLPPAPIWSDLATFDGRRWRGLVDIFTASPPCQPYSVAGKKLGNRDTRSFGEGDGPLVHTLRLIDETQPSVVFFENVGAWVAGREQYFRPFGTALSALGYRIEEPLFIAAADVGAPHERESGSSSWPTARAEDSESSGLRLSRGTADTLTAVSKMWSTPKTPTGGGESAERKKELGRVTSGGGDLQAQAQQWLTPTVPAPNDNDNTSGQGWAKQEGVAHQALRMMTWPTATARDVKGSGTKFRNKHRLDEAAEQRSWKTQTVASSNALMRQTGLHPDSSLRHQTTVGGVLLSKASRTSPLRLNPAFVNWLQGNVWWWTHPALTSFGPREIRWWRYALRQRLSFLLGVLASSKYK